MPSSRYIFSPFVPDFYACMSRPRVLLNLVYIWFFLSQINLLWSILASSVASLPDLRCFQVWHHALNLLFSVVVIPLLNSQRLANIPINQPRFQWFFARIIIFIMLDWWLWPSIVKSLLLFRGWMFQRIFIKRIFSKTYPNLRKLLRVFIKTIADFPIWNTQFMIWVFLNCLRVRHRWSKFTNEGDVLLLRRRELVVLAPVWFSLPVNRFVLYIVIRISI